MCNQRIALLRNIFCCYIVGAACDRQKQKRKQEISSKASASIRLILATALSDSQNSSEGANGKTLVLSRYERAGIVTKIPSTNCSWCYIGETGRAFNSRKRNIWETSKLQPKVLESLITPGPTTTSLILKTRQLLIKAFSVEAWQTKVTPNADYNSCPLPGKTIFLIWQLILCCSVLISLMFIWNMANSCSFQRVFGC